MQGSQRSIALQALVAVVLGGAVGWSLAFAGIGLWGLALGAAASGVVSVILARLTAPPPPLAHLAVFAFAFILLTWPLLWLVVGYVRYVLTGETLGQ